MKLFCDPMVFDRTGGTQAAESLGLRLPDDYLYWVLVFRKDAVNEEDLDRMTFSHKPEESARLSQNLTAHWHPSIRSILTEQDPCAAASLTFLAANPEHLAAPVHLGTDKRTTAITLLGDAAHPMPPVGGFGANAAFLDTAALCDVLCQEGDVAAQIQAYERDMYTRAQSVVQRSIERSGRFFGMRTISGLKYAEVP